MKMPLTYRDVIAAATAARTNTIELDDNKKLAVYLETVIAHRVLMGEQIYEIPKNCG